MAALCDYFLSPVGLLRISWEADALCELSFVDARDLPATPAPPAILARLQAYFEGDLTAIDSIPVSMRGTDFQKQVWTELRRIPAGTTISYGELAARVGRPAASRAVGLANGSNPIAIVVPCHRVIGASGALTGYGGGLDRKRWLLAHEKGRQFLTRAPSGTAG